MFGFLKDKLKGALGKLTKEVEKESVVEKKEVLIERKVEEKKPEKKIEATPTEKTAQSIKKSDEKKESDKKKESNENAAVQKVIEPKKKGFFQKIFGKRDEEEDIIEEKEELRERAEKIIIEPEAKKEIKEEKASKPAPAIEEKKIIFEEKENTVEEKKRVIEERIEPQKPVPKKIDTKIESIINKPVINAIKVEPVIHKQEPVVNKDESVSISNTDNRIKSKIALSPKKQDRKENSISIEINSPISTVFEFTINPKNTPLWIDNISREEANNHPIKLGTEYKNVNRRGEWTTYEVVKLVTDSVFQLKQKNDTYNVRYTYKPLPNNKTELTYTEWVDEGELAEPFSISTLEKLKKAIEKPHHQIVEEERASKTIEHQEEDHKGFFSKITETFTKIQINEEKFEELFWELEVVLLENNVAVEVIDKIKRDLKKELMNGKVSRKGVDELIISTLKQSITELFDVEKINLIKNIKAKKSSKMPYVIAVIGVNGSGKTTSIAKLTYKLQKEGLQVVLAASDTFRAAAIQQLEEHANNLNVKMVKHDYYSDPAAVGFDAIKYAEAKGADVVIIDTAGRLHSNTNLMRELEKVIRVCRPDIKIFVGESITGNDCVEQAKEFDKAVGIDAIILAKADVDDKGGAAISVSYILQRPILYLGTGQTYDDLKEFDSKIIIDSLEL